MIDDKTTKFNLPLPHEDNLLEDDVGRLRETIHTVDRLLGDTAESLSHKAEKEELLPKADMADVKRYLAHKEDITVVDEKLAQLAGATSEQLALKADKDTMDATLAQKADISALQSGMDSKADRQHGHTREEVSGLGTAAPKDIFISTASPSGGKDGDIWIQYV